MRLRTKFNLAMLAAFLVGFALASGFAWQLLHQNAEREVRHEAGIMMAEASAVRGYTDNEIAPLLVDQLRFRFLPHTVPSWAAQTIFRELKPQYPDYNYREPALNPTNPADKATDWEAGIIGEFRLHPTLSEFVRARNTPAGPVLTVSRPLRATEKACLICHSTPDAAPASMLDIYGAANGFGWKLGDVIAAQVVSVPMHVALDRANRLFALFAGALVAAFLVTMALLNLLLHFIIIKPLRRMSDIAEQISTGDMSAPEFHAHSRDEIASLAGSFNRMRRSLINAMKLLEET